MAKFKAFSRVSLSCGNPELPINTYINSLFFKVKQSLKLQKNPKCYGNSQIGIATKLDTETTIVLDSCIQFYMFTNIADMYTSTKYAT